MWNRQQGYEGNIWFADLIQRPLARYLEGGHCIKTCIDLCRDTLCKRLWLAGLLGQLGHPEHVRAVLPAILCQDETAHIELSGARIGWRGLHVRWRCNASVTQIETLYAIARVDPLCCSWAWPLCLFAENLGTCKTSDASFVMCLRTRLCEKKCDVDRRGPGPAPHLAGPADVPFSVSDPI